MPQSGNQQPSSGSKVTAAIEGEPVVVKQGQTQQVTIDLGEQKEALRIANLAASENKLHSVTLVDIDNDVEISPKHISIPEDGKATFSMTPIKGSSGDEKINIIVDGAVVNSFELPVVPKQTILKGSLNKKEVEQGGALTLNMTLQGTTPEALEYKVSLLNDPQNFEITPNNVCALSSNVNCKLSIKASYAANLGENAIVLTPINNKIETPNLIFNIKHHNTAIDGSAIYLIKNIDKILSLNNEDQLRNFGVIVIGFATPCMNSDGLDLSGKICGIGDDRGVSNPWGRLNLSKNEVDFIAYMKKKYGTKFVISFREPGQKSDYQKMFENRGYYSNLAKNFAQMAKSYGFNGIDYDYEPRVWGPDNCKRLINPI